MSNLLDYSQKLKPGDTISNINDGRKAEVTAAYRGGVAIKFNTDDGKRTQYLSHEVVNLAWRWEK